MQNFIISKNEYLKQDIKAYYHTNYTKMGNPGNPDYLNDLKNTFDNFATEKLKNAIEQLYNVLKTDLSGFDKELTVCIIPRSKAENTYSSNQLLFKKVIQLLINELNFEDGSSYILRHTDTKTTHLSRSDYAGSGSMPYPGITKDTCTVSNAVNGKNILLIDDIYTNSVNIDEDAIQALYDNGAKSVIFYAVGKTG